MSIADMLVDAAAEHKIISFMDGNVGHNQIFMAEEDIERLLLGASAQSICSSGL